MQHAWLGEVSTCARPVIVINVRTCHGCRRRFIIIQSALVSQSVLLVVFPAATGPAS